MQSSATAMQCAAAHPESTLTGAVLTLPSRLHPPPSPPPGIELGKFDGLTNCCTLKTFLLPLRSDCHIPVFPCRARRCNSLTNQHPLETSHHVAALHLSCMCLCAGLQSWALQCAGQPAHPDIRILTCPACFSVLACRLGQHQCADQPRGQASAQAVCNGQHGQQQDVGPTRESSAGNGVSRQGGVKDRRAAQRDRWTI